MACPLGRRCRAPTGAVRPTSGVDGRPTLVLNAETLAQLARLARGLPATRLVTVLGAVATPGVVELSAEAPLAEALAAAGGLTEPVRAFVLGGYHGQWWPADEVTGLRLGDPDGPVPDCSIVLALPDHACLLVEVEDVARYLAAESAGQCGPCVFGLPTLADVVRRISRGTADPSEVEAHRAVLAGRGACHHPDGSLGFVASALAVLGPEVADHHAGHGSCGRPERRILPLPRASQAPWADRPVERATTVLAERGA